MRNKGISMRNRSEDVGVKELTGRIESRQQRSSVQVELNRNFDGRADRDTGDGRGPEMPASDCSHRGLVEQDVTRAGLHGQGFDDALGIYQNAEDDRPLLAHLSGFQGINWGGIVAIAWIAPSGTTTASSPLPSARTRHAAATDICSCPLSRSVTARVKIGRGRLRLRGFSRCSCNRVRFRRDHLVGRDGIWMRFGNWLGNGLNGRGWRWNGSWRRYWFADTGGTLGKLDFDAAPATACTRYGILRDQTTSKQNRGVNSNRQRKA